MNEDIINYNAENEFFSVSHRRTLSHNMPFNHFHSTFELFYLVAGKRCFFIKDRTIRIKEGDLVLIRPNILHRTTNADFPQHERIIINFHADFLRTPQNPLFEILSALFDNEYTIISFPPSYRIHAEELLGGILQEVRLKGTGFEMLARTLTLQLLVYSCRFVEQNSAKALVFPSPIHERISEVVRFINEQYTEDLSLRGLSEKFYISPYYLSRIFKEVTGFTFIEYLNSVRIKEAKKLIEESRWKVNKIAEKVGFGSITHFGRVFREITGHAPLYYRKKDHGKLILKR